MFLSCFIAEINYLLIQFNINKLLVSNNEIQLYHLEESEMEWNISIEIQIRTRKVTLKMKHNLNEFSIILIITYPLLYPLEYPTSHIYNDNNINQDRITGIFKISII